VLKLISLKKKFLFNSLKVNWNILVAIKKSKEISLVLVKEYEKINSRPKTAVSGVSTGVIPEWKEED